MLPLATMCLQIAAYEGGPQRPCPMHAACGHDALVTPARGVLCYHRALSAPLHAAVCGQDVLATPMQGIPSPHPTQAYTFCLTRTWRSELTWGRSPMTHIIACRC